MILSVLVSDRGHAPALPEKWAGPRYQRGIVQTMVLHATQRNAAFDAANNCAWIGGWPYSAAMPKVLRIEETASMSSSSATCS